MNVRSLLLLVCAMFVAAGAFAAADTDTLQEENADLKQRLEKLEGQVDRLVQLLDKQPPPPAPTAGADQDFYKGLNEESLKKLAAMVSEQNGQSLYGGKKPVLAGLDVDLYGFVRLDTAYDDSAVSDGGGGSFVKWVDSEGTNDNDDNFTMTGRVSRFGMKISGPESNGIRASGKIEMDFAGGGSETSNAIRMRQAYVNLDWVDKNFSLLAGQAWDIVSPLNPPTIDFGVLWWSGNPGTRRPQIRATQVYNWGDSKVTLAGAIARNSGWGHANGGIPKETGEDSGLPQFQGRIGLATGSTKVGLSGHWGSQEYDLDATGDHEDFDSWSLNVDLVQPINDWITFKGEVFCGENMNMLFAGIGQGVNTTDMTEIGAKGGWAALCMKPWDKWTLNAGYGIDDVDSDDLAAAGGRTKNQTFFGNAVYALNKNTDIGLEVAYRKTDYLTVDDGDNLRIQGMFKYKF